MIAVLAAPSNLGLRPPAPGVEPGCAKAPEALLTAGLADRLGAVDRGEVRPGPYDPAVDPRAGRSRNQDAMVEHAVHLADAVGELLDGDEWPLVVGGDCSILLGIGLALARRGGVGLVHLDGHTDFRHPGNTEVCLDVAGEDLAAVVGRHRPVLADIEGRRPYVDPSRAAHGGCRDDDSHLAEVTDLLAAVWPSSSIGRDVPAAVAALRRGAGDRFWLHLDVDILDPAFLSAVDSPDPGGLDPDRLIDLLRGLAPHAVGADVTVFDPDLDPDRTQAALLVDVLAAALDGLGSRPV